MSELPIWGGIIRKLWPTEVGKFREHLLRLDPESRRMRFAHAVSDVFIEDYANRMHHMGSIVYGYFEGPHLRAAAELRKLSAVWGEEAEAAFSVEKDWQGKGIGTARNGASYPRCAQSRCEAALYELPSRECENANHSP